jgi:hypothetical protein
VKFRGARFSASVEKINSRMRSLVSKINGTATQLLGKMQAGTHNIGVLEIRLLQSSVEAARKWLVWESLKQQAGRWLSLHFLLDSRFILDTTRRVIPARRILITQAFSGCTRTIGDSFQLPDPLDQHEWREQDPSGVHTPGAF